MSEKRADLAEVSAKQWLYSNWRKRMNEEALNTSLRKFLKKVGVTSQREIEIAVRKAVAEGGLKGGTVLPAKAVVTVEAIGLSFEIDGAIELE
jgi:hypothetical protein